MGPPGAGLATWRLRRVIRFIEEHFEERLPLALLASEAGLSRMHFAAQFRVATGHSPASFIRRRRIDEARRLLAETDMPVVEVALTTGFQTQAHFTSLFSRLVGAPPATWRRGQRPPRNDARPDRPSSRAPGTVDSARAGKSPTSIN